MGEEGVNRGGRSEWGEKGVNRAGQRSHLDITKDKNMVEVVWRCPTSAQRHRPCQRGIGKEQERYGVHGGEGGVNGGRRECMGGVVRAWRGYEYVGSLIDGAPLASKLFLCSFLACLKEFDHRIYIYMKIHSVGFHTKRRGIKYDR